MRKTDVQGTFSAGYFAALSGLEGAFRRIAEEEGLVLPPTPAQGVANYLLEGGSADVAVSYLRGECVHDTSAGTCLLCEEVLDFHPIGG